MTVTFFSSGGSFYSWMNKKNDYTIGKKKLSKKPWGGEDLFIAKL